MTLRNKLIIKSSMKTDERQGIENKQRLRKIATHKNFGSYECGLRSMRHKFESKYAPHAYILDLGMQRHDT